MRAGDSPRTFLAEMLARQAKLRRLPDGDLAESDRRMLAGELFDAVDHCAVMREVGRGTGLTTHQRLAEELERQKARGG